MMARITIEILNQSLETATYAKGEIEVHLARAKPNSDEWNAWLDALQKMNGVIAKTEQMKRELPLMNEMMDMIATD